MLNVVATVSAVALGMILAAPVMAQDLDVPRRGDGSGMRRVPDLQVRPRGQREQVAPPADDFSTEEPDADDDDDLDDPDDAPPADRRL
ncbi:hypothetical protein [Methylobacterium sp. Leaf117]|uniref:hypothetical protein n=1 Tax=Methylobacterium sp. Leaf117 TaxID=1736260 RepID=UPI00072AE448|nr:hypothetical protein [Methylobacterium sp. Leaf117]KQP89395.1 hypothetical protein ASF57_23850 [Methylobacterium sp. Leaf117]